MAEVMTHRRFLPGIMREGGGLPIILGAGTILGLATLAAAFPGIAPQDPGAIDGSRPLVGIGGGHWLGTDNLGRDVFSRLVDGARTGLIGPLLLAAATTVLSTAVALVAGYAGGRIDAVVGRLVDLAYSIPPMIVAIVVVGVTAGGWWTALVVLILFGLPLNIRLMRAAVIVRARLPFIEAARTSGASHVRVVLCHLLPTIVPFVMAVFFLSFTYGIVDLSALSFLGLGVPPGSPDWGRMVSENRAYLFQNAWATVGPVGALVAVAVAANVLGDWIYTRYERRGVPR